MEKYTKEQITEIVHECSEYIIQKNKDKFINNVTEIVKYKSEPEALFDILTLFYCEIQQNCNEVLIETLDELLN
nr:MAG TPA: hypothetical protein [Caudoviricetes sp.]